GRRRVGHGDRRRDLAPGTDGAAGVPARGQARAPRQLRGPGRPGRARAPHGAHAPAVPPHPGRRGGDGGALRGRGRVAPAVHPRTVGRPRGLARRPDRRGRRPRRPHDHPLAFGAADL
ncbi:MAG: hypothetical protein AVDCRST_MAG11-2199, partial [uncultured Gemmatimonadaceae bacterium]